MQKDGQVAVGKVVQSLMFPVQWPILARHGVLVRYMRTGGIHMSASGCLADGKWAAVKALREGQATIPDDGSPNQRSVRATNYTSWMECDAETEIDFEEVMNPQSPHQL